MQDFSKFSEIKYERPNFKQVRKDILDSVKIMKKAKTYEEFKKGYLHAENAMQEMASMVTISSIRNTIDMNDKFYDEEEKYLNRAGATVALASLKLLDTVLSSNFKDDINKEYGPYLLKQLENNKKIASKKIIFLSIKEGTLSQKYSKLVANAKTTFMNEECNFYGLLKHMQSTNREERKEAFFAFSKLYESIASELDNIYTELVDVRCKTAKRLKFDSYIDYIYLRRGRYDYTKKDVAAFRESVRKYIVPLCQKLFDMQKEDLGIDKLHFYDEDLTFKDGNAKPEGTWQELVKKASLMYSELSSETKEFFDFMTEHELFDLETRPGKHMGGYCTFIPKYKAPFIFSNFNGTSADVDVLTHEAGHAFQFYLGSRNIDNEMLQSSTSEIDEIHSMTMEHFTYPFMDKFFKENKNKYLYHHLTNAVKVIPYLVSVDEFQHKVFENPKMSASERRATWKEIEKTYMPWRDYDNDNFFENGAFWMQKQHIFLYPFYYVDYALAQSCAFQLFLRGIDNFDVAWSDYVNLCKAGGTKGYFDLLAVARLESPFEEKTIKDIASKIEKVIDGFRAKVKE